MFFYLILNPVTIALEKIGLLKPALVAIVDHKVSWPDEDPDDAAEFATYDEELSFFLLEYPSGRRSYDLHEYGRCDTVDFHEVYLRDVLAWTYGGPLPKGAVRPGQAAEVVSLKVLKGQAAD